MTETRRVESSRHTERRGWLPTISAMLHRAAARSSSCWRRPGRFVHPGLAGPRSIPPPKPTILHHGSQLRIFTTKGNLLNKQVSRDTPEQQSPATAATPTSARKPEDVDKGKTAKNEAISGRKEQRKADWAIMKEMSRYLWPKVRVVWYISTCSVVTEEYFECCRMIGVRSFVSGQRYRF